MPTEEKTTPNPASFRPLSSCAGKGGAERAGRGFPLRRLLPAPIVFALLFAALPAFATDVEILGVRVADRKILVSVATPGLVGPKMRARLESGQKIATTIRFYVHSVGDWWDEELAIASLDVEASWDAATAEYTARRLLGRRVLLEKKVRTLGELRDLLERYDDIPAFEISPEWAGEPVYVKARVWLGTTYLLGVIPTAKWTDKTFSARFRLP
jgi:hypothetical protein